MWGVDFEKPVFFTELSEHTYLVQNRENAQIENTAMIK